jgi:hypothetical protein
MVWNAQYRKPCRSRMTNENHSNFFSNLLNPYTRDIHITKTIMLMVNILTITSVFAPRAQPAACWHEVEADTWLASPASQLAVMLTMKLPSCHQSPSKCTLTDSSAYYSFCTKSIQTNIFMPTVS